MARSIAHAWTRGAEFLRWARILPRNPTQPLGKYILKHLPVLILFTVLTLVAEAMGWLRGFETYGLDILLRLQSASSPTPIYLVVIDDEDYRTMFQSTSPLAAPTLQGLLHDIARGGPRVIGVDIETSHASFSVPGWPDAVWARDDLLPSEASDQSQVEGDHQGDHDSSPGEAHASSHGPEPVLRGTALGGLLREQHLAEGALCETEPKSGLPLFPTDHDGVIRRYHRVFFSPGTMSGDHRAAYVDALPWAIVKQYAQSLPTGHANLEPQLVEDLNSDLHALEERIILNYAGDRARFKRITARDVQRAARQDYWPQNSPLKNAIVLVGGTYAAARDSYFTPVGPRFGVELIAHAVETDLTGGGIREFDHRVDQFLDPVVGLVFLVVTWRFPGRGAFHIALASTVILSLAASYVAFRALAYWFNFAPMLVGQLLHLEWERSKELKELRHEVKDLKQELATHRSQPTASREAGDSEPRCAAQPGDN